MGPAVVVHHVPEACRIELVEIGDHRDKDALHAFVVKRPREMVMIDQETLLPGTDDHGDHMRAQKVDKRLGIAFPPGFALQTHFAHADRHLGRPQFENRSGVQDRFR